MRVLSGLILIVFFYEGWAWGECGCYTRTPLDLVLILDATDSMGDKVRVVQSEVAGLLKVLRNNTSELRVGQVSYGKSLQADGFTSDPKEMQARLDALEVFGNFEPVDLALEKALAMEWSSSARKVIILIGDEPPDVHDQVTSAQRSYELAATARERGIIVHTVSALGSQNPLTEFVEIARRGGGEAVVLPHLLNLGATLARLCLGRPIDWGEELALPPQEFVPPGGGPLLIQKMDAGTAWGLDRDDLTRLLIASHKVLGTQYSWAPIHPNAEVEEYEKAPILYLSAHGKLDLPPETWARIHDYVVRGGFILADACCNDEEFDRSFRHEMAKLFPSHPLMRLSPANAIYNGTQKIQPEEQVLLGIQFECRTAVIYCPYDLSCRWAKGPQRGKVVVSEETAFALGANILEHIVRYHRLVSKAPRPLMDVQAPDRKVVAVAQVIFAGNWDPTTQTLEDVLKELGPSGIQPQRHAIRLTDESLYNYPILFLTGHGEIGLTDPEVARLKEYLEKGGFLFANACCGDTIFDGSFRLLVKRLALGAGLVRIPIDQNVYNIPNKLRRVALTRTDMHPEGRQADFVLEGVESKGRWVIVYSPRDASGGLLDTPCSLCDGYLGADARRILTNILLYGLAK